MRRIAVLGLSFAVAAFLAACGDHVTNVDNHTQITISQGDTSRPGTGATGVTIDIFPRVDSALPGAKTKAYAIVKGTTDHRVSWESRDRSIITVPATTDTVVDVSYIAPGATNLCLTSLADPTAKTCGIRITRTPQVHVDTTVVAASTTLTLACGVNTGTISWVTAPIANLPVTLVSKNTSIATVDQTGKVTRVAAGTTTVTGTVNGTNIHFDVTVTMSDCPPPPPPSGAKISVNPTTIVAAYGTGGCTTAAKTITATTDSAVTGVTWSVSGNGVVTLSPSGNVVTVTFVGPGQVVVTASTKGANGVTVSAETAIMVSPCTPPAKPQLVINPINQVFNFGSACVAQAYQLQFHLLNPDGSTTANPVVDWSSDKTNVVTVNSTGLLTTVGPGDAIVTGKLHSDPTVTASIAVHVTNNSCQTTTGISIGLNVAGGTLQVGQHQDVKATVLGTMDKKVSFSTSNSAVLTYTQTSDSTATVNIVGVGTASFCGTAHVDSTKQACVTYVGQAAPAPTVTISCPTPITVGGTGKCTYTVSGTSDNVVLWSSSNSSVLTVNQQTGEIKAWYHGTATITAVLNSNRAVFDKKDVQVNP